MPLILTTVPCLEDNYAFIIANPETGEAAVVDLDIVVGVPRLADAVPDLDEADPFFEETAGGEELAALGGVAVELANGGGFAGDGECVGGL